MASSKKAPTPALVALSAVALSVALTGCQRTQPLPAERTQELIRPVARVELSSAPPPAPVAASATAPAPAAEAAPAPTAAPAPAAAPAAPQAAPQKAAASGRMVLGEITFEGSGAVLPGDAAATVEAVANYVTANPGVRVEIATHADKSGADVARERAQAIRTALMSSGVKEDQIAIGAGATGDAKAAQRVALLLAGTGPAAAQGAAPAGAASATASAAAGGTKADGKAVYDKTCVACHSAGVAGAPKVGDKAAWAPRLAGGIGALVQSALKGKGAMPPKGGNSALSEAEIKSAVEHMVSLSK